MEKVLDMVGLGLAAAMAAWTGLVAGSAASGEVRRAPAVMLVVAVVAAVAVGRVVGERRPLVVPVAVALGVSVALLSALPSPWQSAGPPLGYANANAALASLGALAAGGVALSAGVAQRFAWLVLAAVLTSLVLVSTSVAAALSLATVGMLVGAAAWRRSARVAVAGGAAAVTVMLGLTITIGLGVDPAGLGTRSAARGELWVGAVELARENPWQGSGPGAFAELNPVTDDPDLRWAHHGYLQAAAELGLPGLALGLALLGWAYARLWAARQAPVAGRPWPAQIAVATGALTALALHATVDYVLHFPALPLVVALLLGWGTAPQDRLAEQLVVRAQVRPLGVPVVGDAHCA